MSTVNWAFERLYLEGYLRVTVVKHTLVAHSIHELSFSDGSRLTVSDLPAGESFNRDTLRSRVRPYGNDDSLPAVIDDVTVGWCDYDDVIGVRTALADLRSEGRTVAEISVDVQDTDRGPLIHYTDHHRAASPLLQLRPPEPHSPFYDAIMHAAASYYACDRLGWWHP